LALETLLFGLVAFALVAAAFFAGAVFVAPSAVDFLTGNPGFL
jgi:hypothetical protein